MYKVTITFLLFFCVGCLKVPVDCEKQKGFLWSKATEQSYQIALIEMPQQYAEWTFAHVEPWIAEAWSDDELQPPTYYLWFDNEWDGTHPDDPDFYSQAHKYWLRTVEIRKEVMAEYPCDFQHWSNFDEEQNMEKATEEQGDKQ